MEFNGIANILALIEMAKMDNNIDPKLYSDITNQCDVLERYLIAVSVAKKRGNETPKWHEVRDNPHKYGKNR